MLEEWIRFDKRIIHFVKLWNVKNIFHIYGWWFILFWPIEWMLGLTHLVGVGHLLQIGFRIQSRPLNLEEIKLANAVFGNRIQYSKVRINSNSRFAARLRIAFVTGHVINYHTLNMTIPLFIHEMTHVYQYEKVGLVYIPRCLFAQASKAGYYFGKVDDHLDILNGTSDMRKLNYEQQAEFLEALIRQNQFTGSRVASNAVFAKINFHV